jgi:hypothetical protein
MLMRNSVMISSKLRKDFEKYFAYYSNLGRNNMLFVPGGGNRYRGGTTGGGVVASGYTRPKEFIIENRKDKFNEQKLAFNAAQNWNLFSF